MFLIVAKSDTHWNGYQVDVKVVVSQEEVPWAFYEAIKTMHEADEVAEAFKDIVENVELDWQETVKQKIWDWNTEVSFNKFWMQDDNEMEYMNIEAIPVYDLIWKDFYSM